MIAAVESGKVIGWAQDAKGAVLEAAGHVQYGLQLFPVQPDFYDFLKLCGDDMKGTTAFQFHNSEGDLFVGFPVHNPEKAGCELLQD
jgi:hypothetical protein